MPNSVVSDEIAINPFVPKDLKRGLKLIAAQRGCDFKLVVAEAIAEHLTRAGVVVSAIPPPPEPPAVPTD
jgi:hypothetical protein